MPAYDGLDTCTIFDFETLSTNPADGVAVSMAMLNFYPGRFSTMPYSYEDLLDKTHFIKLNVDDQVKNHNRKIMKNTLEWWSKQGDEAKKQIQPLPNDQKISDLYAFFVVNKATNLEKIFTRRNTFDPIFMLSLMRATNNPDPYDWWIVRDTISYIEGLSHGVEMRNDFVPEGLKDKFVKHDPRHDIVMDVMRMQTLVKALEVGDE
jgi:hypothetical protein